MLWSAWKARLGKVGEVQDAAFKVDAPFKPDYWLPLNTMASVDEDRISLTFPVLAMYYGAAGQSFSSLIFIVLRLLGVIWSATKRHQRIPRVIRRPLPPPSQGT